MMNWSSICGTCYVLTDNDNDLMGEIVWKRSLQLIVKSVAYVAHRICSSLDEIG